MATQKPLVLINGQRQQIPATDTVDPGNLGTGTRDGSKFLRDDGTWAAPSGGGGTPGGSTGQVQYNNAGAFDGASGVKVTAAEDLNLATEYTTTSPSAPSAGAVPFARKRTGRTFLASQGIVGSAEELQAHLAFKRVQLVASQAGASGFSIIGQASLSTVGTMSTPGYASTNFLTQLRRTIMFSASTAGSTASVRQGNTPNVNWRGNAAGLGGFYYVHRFTIEGTQTGYIFYAGLRASGAAITATTAASSLTDIIGVGIDPGDTNLFIMHNDNAGTATRIDTSIAVSTTTAYALRIYCEPNGTTIYISVENLSSGVVFETSITTNIPANTTFLSWIQHISNNATAAAVTCGFLDLYIESNN